MALWYRWSFSRNGNSVTSSGNSLKRFFERSVTERRYSSLRRAKRWRSLLPSLWENRKFARRRVISTGNWNNRSEALLKIRTPRYKDGLALFPKGGLQLRAAAATPKLRVLVRTADYTRKCCKSNKCYRRCNRPIKLIKKQRYRTVLIRYRCVCHGNSCVPVRGFGLTGCCRGSCYEWGAMATCAHSLESAGKGQG